MYCTKVHDTSQGRGGIFSRAEYDHNATYETTLTLLYRDGIQLGLTLLMGPYFHSALSRVKWVQGE